MSELVNKMPFTETKIVLIFKLRFKLVLQIEVDLYLKTSMVVAISS